MAAELSAALIREGRPLLLLPQPSALYGGVVTVLHQAVAAGLGIRVALPGLAGQVV